MINREEAMIGHFATSKAGHDKSRVYIITGEEGAYVYLCDGRYKPLAGPKKKNIKHIQLINRKVDQDLLFRLANKEDVFDEQIKYAIKSYLNEEKL